MYIVTGFRPLLCLSSSSHHDYNSTLLVASLVVNPTFARTINFTLSLTSLVIGLSGNLGLVSEQAFAP